MWINLSICSCQNISPTANNDFNEVNNYLVGAENTHEYLDLLKNKRVGVVVNKASEIGGEFMVDSLIASYINIVSIFTPEHGLSASKSAGELINDPGFYLKIPVKSLYGSSKKMKSSWLTDLDILVFDLQDVGVRFYTYISTLHYVMEACAVAGVPLIVLDRPNPFTNVVDGYVLDSALISFIGMHPVPVQYGLTIGEFADMIKGEGWIKNSELLDLKVVACDNYRRGEQVTFNKAPSPNLRSLQAIYNYPSLCFFEGTIISVGRGTVLPFEVFGHTKWLEYDTVLIPKSQESAHYPKFQDELCKFQLYNASTLKGEILDLDPLLKAYKYFANSDEKFFSRPDHFDKLAGSSLLRKMIESGKSESEIRSSWNRDIENYKLIRQKYLIHQYE